MKINYKKTSLASLSVFLLFFSANTFAQKSVYDVIPGSGPKNKKTVTIKKSGTSLPDIINGNQKRDDERVYKGNRRHLPPGQAKKIYGGRAKDYAPGQMKKHHSKHWKKHDKKHHDNDEKRGKDKHKDSDD